ERLARQANVTSFMVLHAALAVLLARLSGSSDIVVGAPVAGRSKRALAPLVGMFVNTIPLRTEVRAEETFTEFLRRVGEIDVEGFAHSDLPYERIVDHLDPRRGGEPDPLCRVYLAFENMLRPRLELSGATVEILDPGPQAAKTDLVVTVAENAAAGSDIPLRIDYAADLFDQATVEEFAARLNRVLAALVAEPGTRVGAVEVLSEAERARLVPAAGRRAEPARVLAEVLAVRDPEAVAVIAGDRSLTYGALATASNRLARELIARGIGPGDHVALVMPRSVEFVVAMWAVARSGAAFVPVDPRNPAERVALMIADAEAAVAVTVIGAGELVPDPVPTLVLDDPAVAATLARHPAAPVTDAERTRPSRVADTAYVLYTSGSTGAPKGVAVTSEGLANFAAEQRERYAVEAGARVLQLAAPGFDAVVLELLMAHACGAALVVSPPEVFAGPELAELVRAHG